MHQFSPSPGARYETLGAVTASTSGTTVTSTTAHSKGSWVNIGSPTSFTYEMLSLTVFNNSNASNYVIDVGIRVGSDYFVIAANVYVSLRKTAAIGSTLVPFALHVPAGSQLACRIQTSGTSLTVGVVLIGCSNGLGGMPGYSRLILLSTISSSKGHVIDGGVVAHTKGAVVQLTAGTPERVVGLLGAIDIANDTARSFNRWLLDILLYASTEYVLIPDIPLSGESLMDIVQPEIIGPFPCDIPAGTRIAARAQSAITTAGDRTFGLSLYGYVP